MIFINWNTYAAVQVFIKKKTLILSKSSMYRVTITVCNACAKGHIHCMLQYSTRWALLNLKLNGIALDVSLNSSVMKMAFLLFRQPYLFNVYALYVMLCFWFWFINVTSYFSHMSTCVIVCKWWQRTCKCDAYLDMSTTHTTGCF